MLQPLNAARLFASALRETTDNDERTHLAERVDTALRAAEDLLDGLLDVSRLNAGALQPELSHFDAAEMLQELAAQYAPSAAGRGLSLRVYAGEDVFVRSDRRLLRRALQNFLANALRYTREGGVLLGLRRRGQQIECQVWDTGPGIPEHHLTQIFEEFRRFDQPGVGGERGLGLGLSICQRIARTLDHPLRVNSRVGSGSVFSIRVPVGVVTRQPVLREVAPASDALAGLRVLCVDNDPEILNGMRALLGRWKAIALTAATVDEALAHIDSSNPESLPDVALVDYHLHDRLDGLGVIAELRRRAKRDLRSTVDRRWQRHAETRCARIRMRGADQAGEAGVVAGLVGGVGVRLLDVEGCVFFDGTFPGVHAADIPNKVIFILGCRDNFLHAVPSPGRGQRPHPGVQRVASLRLRAMRAARLHGIVGT